MQPYAKVENQNHNLTYHMEPVKRKLPLLMLYPNFVFCLCEMYIYQFNVLVLVYITMKIYICMLYNNNYSDTPVIYR